MTNSVRRPKGGLKSIQWDYDRYLEKASGDEDIPEIAFNSGVVDGLIIAARAMGFDLGTGKVRDV
ncbi:MAG: hypothetical protein GY926_17970 [bacterium]|nr:hypothetical protein [bacterium]